MEVALQPEGSNLCLRYCVINLFNKLNLQVPDKVLSYTDMYISNLPDFLCTLGIHAAIVRPCKNMGIKATLWMFRDFEIILHHNFISTEIMHAVLVNELKDKHFSAYCSLFGEVDLPYASLIEKDRGIGWQVAIIQRPRAEGVEV